MTRIIQILAVLAITTWPALSSAYMEVLTRSYELSVDEVTLPAHEAGQVVVQPCEGCSSVVHPVNSATTYHIGVRSPAVSLGDLLAAIDSGAGTLVLVAVDQNTGAVARITLDTGE